jgi:uncharacterized protein
VKFAAIIEYIQDEAAVQAVRPTHREYLRGLKESGRLVTSGPFTDGSGALIVYEAHSAQQAETLIRDDPFHGAGVFASWVLRPWNQVM